MINFKIICKMKMNMILIKQISQMVIIFLKVKNKISILKMINIVIIKKIMQLFIKILIQIKIKKICKLIIKVSTLNVKIKIKNKNFDNQY